ncbi:MAG TPA: YciI family protein [Candidatus Polarisedimenticolaceae bacterium]|nr:YciI family protein [Candidatus Polarisedimenticolaceae bacterium]
MRTILATLALLCGLSALAADMPSNMTTYYFGILEKGDRWTPGDTPELQKIQEGHLAHLTAMWKAGKLVLAGPLGDAGDWRGVLIYRTRTIEEAQTLANDDPAVKAGRLKVTMHPWWVQKGILPDPLENPDSKPKP